MPRSRKKKVIEKLIGKAVGGPVDGHMLSALNVHASQQPSEHWTFVSIGTSDKDCVHHFYRWEWDAVSQWKYIPYKE